MKAPQRRQGQRRAAQPEAKRADGIWSSPRIKTMLEQPLGAPVTLTREEAIAIARAAFGKRPELPSGAEYVRSVKDTWKGLLKKKRG